MIRIKLVFFIIVEWLECRVTAFWKETQNEWKHCFQQTVDQTWALPPPPHVSTFWRVKSAGRHRPGWRPEEGCDWEHIHTDPDHSLFSHLASSSTKTPKPVFTPGCKHLYSSCKVQHWEAGVCGNSLTLLQQSSNIWIRKNLIWICAQKDPSFKNQVQILPIIITVISTVTANVTITPYYPKCWSLSKKKPSPSQPVHVLIHFN